MVGTPRKQVNETRKFLKGLNRASTFAPWTPYELVFVNTFDQVSINHGREWKTNPYSDVGGPWIMNRSTNLISPITINDSVGNGPYYCGRATGFTSAARSALTDAALAVFGTKAISEVSPNNPAFSLPRAIGELKKDGIPNPSGTELWREKSHFLRGSGSEYLNLEFGWKPLVADLHSFARTVIDHHKVLEGYHKGAGQKARRRFVAPPDRTTKCVEGGGFLSPSSPSRSCKAYTSSVDVQTTWFSGCFKYYLPIDDSMSRSARHYADAKKLLGVRLTPDTLWELAPWSWAADWAANTGDIVTNVSNLGVDGLAMHYGYVMTHSSYEESTSFEYQGKSGFYRQLKETKKRMPATPYGFGSTFDGLSTRQKAIAAALGLTRVR